MILNKGSLVRGNCIFTRANGLERISFYCIQNGKICLGI